MAIQVISPQEAFEMTKTGAIFVDVREPAEIDVIKYDLKNIIYLPLSENENKFHEALVAHQDKPIILACRSGVRSMKTASILEMHGFKDLYTLINFFMFLGLDV
jgi:rhodanese-related sulfurtransferase